MFFAKFKSQMLFWCLFAAGSMIHRFIENFSNFDVLRLLINVGMMFTVAFIMYAVSYPFISLFNRLKTSRIKQSN